MLMLSLYLFADASMIPEQTLLIWQKISVSRSPDCRYVDLWIDGEYQNGYLLCEKVEIGTKPGLNLKKWKQLFLSEHDDAYYKDEPVYPPIMITLDTSL